MTDYNKTTNFQKRKEAREKTIDEPVAVKPPAKKKAKTGVVTVYKLNIRELPTRTSRSLDILSKDDKVTIISEAGDWMEVKSNNVERGYVMSEFIEANQ